MDTYLEFIIIVLAIGGCFGGVIKFNMDRHKKPKILSKKKKREELTKK